MICSSSISLSRGVTRFCKSLFTVLITKLVIGDTRPSSSGVRPIISTWATMSMMIVGKVSAPPTILAFHDLAVTFSTHCDVAHISELDILHSWGDVLKVADVHLDHTGDVDRLDKDVQHDVGHVEFEAKEASHLK